MSISNSSQSLSISVIYKSLFNISTQAGAFISEARTTQASFFFNFNHSTQISFLDKTNHLRFNIISITVSFTQGIVEYS
jgi:hypothetical protein